jgi:ferredoxin
VFISHNTEEDGGFARRLANDLRQLGLRVWIAPDSIRPGEDWVDAINRGLEESSHMVVVLTPAALSSRWVRKETSAAISLERRGRIELIPLEVKPCTVPALWDSYQTVSLRHDYQAGLEQLTRKLGWGVAPSGPERRPRQVWPSPPARASSRFLNGTLELHSPPVDARLEPARGIYRIDPDSCIACGACEVECPVEGISEDLDGFFVIDPNLCDGCAGSDTAWCAEVCPTEACVPVTV